jgi:hypothetical protein
MTAGGADPRHRSPCHSMRATMSAHPLWPVLPMQEQLAPWLPMFIGLALAVAFVILVVDSVERL